MASVNVRLERKEKFMIIHGMKVPKPIPIMDSLEEDDDWTELRRFEGIDTILSKRQDINIY